MMNSNNQVQNKRYHSAQTLQKIGGAHPYILYVANINLISKPDKDITIKENCTLIHLINMHVKILNKILENHIQQNMNIIMYHDLMGLSQGMVS